MLYGTWWIVCRKQANVGDGIWYLSKASPPWDMSIELFWAIKKKRMIQCDLYHNQPTPPPKVILSLLKPGKWSGYWHSEVLLRMWHKPSMVIYFIRFSWVLRFPHEIQRPRNECIKKTSLKRICMCVCVCETKAKQQKKHLNYCCLKLNPFVKGNGGNRLFILHLHRVWLWLWHAINFFLNNLFSTIFVGEVKKQNTICRRHDL